MLISICSIIHFSKINQYPSRDDLVNKVQKITNNPADRIHQRHQGRYSRSQQSRKKREAQPRRYQKERAIRAVRAAQSGGAYSELLRKITTFLFWALFLYIQF